MVRSSNTYRTGQPQIDCPGIIDRCRRQWEFQKSDSRGWPEQLRGPAVFSLNNQEITADPEATRTFCEEIGRPLTELSRDGKAGTPYCTTFIHPPPSRPYQSAIAMHKLRPGSICRAPNAFRVDNLLDSLFRQPTSTHCFNKGRYRYSTSTVRQNAVAARENNESTDPSERSDTTSVTPADSDAQSAGPIAQSDVDDARSEGPTFTKVVHELSRSERSREFNNKTSGRGIPTTEIHDPSSLENTIELHKQVVDAPKIYKVKQGGEVDWLRPEFTLKERRDRMAQKGLQQKREMDRVLAQDPLLGDDPTLNTHFNRHLKLEVQAQGGDKSAVIKAIKEDYAVRQVKHKAGKPYKVGVSDYEGRYVLPIAAETVPVEKLPWVKGLENPNITGIDR